MKINFIVDKITTRLIYETMKHPVFLFYFGLRSFKIEKTHPTIHSFSIMFKLRCTFNLQLIFPQYVNRTE